MQGSLWTLLWVAIGWLRQYRVEIIAVIVWLAVNGLLVCAMRDILAADLRRFAVSSYKMWRARILQTIVD